MDFDIGRMRRSHWFIGGGGVALFILVFFFKWFGVSTSSPVGGFNVSYSYTGWHTFTNSRWIWLITIILAIGLAISVVGQRKLDLPISASSIVAAFGALSTLLILYRIIDHPTASASFGNFHASAGIKIGIWLGLIAAAVITYGGYLAMQEEGTSIADVREQVGRAVEGVTSSSGTQEPAASSPPPPAAPANPEISPEVSGDGPPAT